MFITGNARGGGGRSKLTKPKRKIRSIVNRKDKVKNEIIRMKKMSGIEVQKRD